MPVLRGLLADLATRSSRLTRSPPRTARAARGVPAVPDLGPAVVVDQLAVLVWDAYAAGRGDGIPELLTASGARWPDRPAHGTGRRPICPVRNGTTGLADGATFRAWPTAMFVLGTPILTS